MRKRTEIEYTAVPVIPVDELEHSESHRFCNDPTCPCHEDQDLINSVNRQYQAGLLSEDDATRIVQGKVI